MSRSLARLSDDPRAPAPAEGVEVGGIDTGASLQSDGTVHWDSNTLLNSVGLDANVANSVIAAGQAYGSGNSLGAFEASLNTMSAVAAATGAGVVVAAGFEVLGQATAAVLALDPAQGGDCCQSHSCEDCTWPKCAPAKGWDPNPPAPGTFEDFYYRMFIDQWNRFADRCNPPATSIPDAVLLAQAVRAWNLTHAASVTRTITRVGLNRDFVWQGRRQFGPYQGDPISLSLESLAEQIHPEGDGSQGVTMSFTINDGPLTPVLLFPPGSIGYHPGGSPAPIPVTVHVGKRPAPKTSSGAAVALGGAAVAAAAVALLRPSLARAALARLASVWRSHR